VPVTVNATFGGAGIFGKPEVKLAWKSLAAKAGQSRAPYVPGQGLLLDVQVFVSGDVWQHRRSGVRLGHNARTSRSLQVQIYVPDEVTTWEQATVFFTGALTEAAELVRDRPRRRVPDLPAAPSTDSSLVANPA
jgi:hypothetical protein